VSCCGFAGCCPSAIDAEKRSSSPNFFMAEYLKRTFPPVSADGLERTSYGGHCIASFVPKFWYYPAGTPKPVRLKGIVIWHWALFLEG